MVDQIPAPIPSALQHQSLVLPTIPAPTTASADFSLRLAPSPFQAQGEISPGKNALLPCTTAGLRRLILDHKSFAVRCPLALIGTASYPVLVHRLAVSLHTSSPRSVALPQLCFTSLAVVSSRRDFHPQECAHAGRTTQKGPPCWVALFTVLVPLTGIELVTFALRIGKPTSCHDLRLDGPGALTYRGKHDLMALQGRKTHD
jgi:hypothetical protein